MNRKDDQRQTVPLLDLRNLSKRFGDFAALDDVSLALRAGERHALLGENGAGKSTLVKIVYGVLRPSEGRLFWNGEPMRASSPAEARALGVGMVFQHFSTFDALTVAENVALALPPEPLPALRRRMVEVSETYGLAVDPARPMHALSVGERQRVEIVRCLLQAPKLLIMDEPTSVLTPQEADRLFETLRRLSEEGRTILYISHRLEEVRALCDAATVLRRGRVVARVDPRRESAKGLAEAMVGESVAAVERAPAAPGAPRLRVDRLSLAGEPPFGVSLRDVSLEVRGGEVLGVAGVAGEGQGELVEALMGERLADRPEAVTLDGKAAGRLGPNARRRLGAAFAPEERNGHAAIGEMTLAENVVLAHHAPERLSRGGWISARAAARWAERIVEAFDVRTGSRDPRADTLSGGNLQKFVIGREILREPGVLVVNQPTWGVDAGAASAIRRALIDLSRRGAAVLVVSQDLDELFEICDRIAVIHRGRLSPPEPAASLTPERVGLLMGGAHPERDGASALEAAE